MTVNENKKRKTFGTVVLVAVLGLILMGCGGDQEAAEGTTPEEGWVVVAEVDAPLRDPAWAPTEGVALALHEDGRELVRLRTDASFDATRSFLSARSEELDGVAGENLALESGRRPDLIYVSKPERDQVTVVENDDLLEVTSISAGESPVRVALGGESTGLGSQTLFALSADGSVVTAVRFEDREELGETEVGGSEGTLIEASRAGAGRAFWLAGPEGVALHELGTSEPRAASRMSAAALAVDSEQPERAYAGESGSGRLVAFEPEADGRLEAVAETDLGEEVLQLAVEPDRLYALTESRLVVLDAGSLEAVEEVDLQTDEVREAVPDARPSGLAVGEEDVFVTLEGEPFVLLTNKP